MVAYTIFFITSKVIELRQLTTATALIFLTGATRTFLVSPNLLFGSYLGTCFEETLSKFFQIRIVFPRRVIEPDGIYDLLTVNVDP